MNDFPLRQQVTPPAKKSRKKNCLFGCLGTAIGVPILLVLIGYYVLMHTAVPLRIFAKTINQDDNVTIEGIGGSISKGFTVETLRYSDDSGNESILEGLTLKWGDIDRMRKNQELVIEEIGLRRAHIFVDTSDTEEEPTAEESSETTDPGEPLKLFEIKKVDIREVLIESKSGDFRLEVDEILMKGFRVQGDEFELASLTVGSNFIDLDLEDADPVTIAGEKIPFTRRLVGVLKPGMHESLAKEIDFSVELGAIGGEMVSRFSGFKGAVEGVNLGKGEYAALTITGFTPADYFVPDSAGPMSKFSLEMRSGEVDQATGLRPALLESGSFTLGTALFAMTPQVLSEDQEEFSDQSALPPATIQRGAVEITATLKEVEKPPFYRVDLSSKPERGQKEIIALLWFEKAPADLTPAEASEVDAIQDRDFPAGN